MNERTVGPVLVPKLGKLKTQLTLSVFLSLSCSLPNFFSVLHEQGSGVLGESEGVIQE